MRELTVREKILLGVCFGVIFLVVNGFAARSIVKNLRGSGDKIAALKSELADQEMWLSEAEMADARERWLNEKMPSLSGTTLGKEQGDLLQMMQDEIFDRKLKIESQSLQDIEQEIFYTEVAVRLRVRGNEADVIDWLISLQGPEEFRVIKAMELEIDSKAKEEEPQAVCEITIARWYAASDSKPLTKDSPGESSDQQG
ncbi:MAG: hypothetical protein P1U58_12505 [Verrucomicrobiales bacterium]|nr:hypothetical protein [Verrucomicrobiales bacterium]